MNINKEELMKDEALLAELAEASTPEMIQDTFLKKGIELTADEAQQVLDQADSDEELSEKELTDVAGGFAEVFGLVCALAFVVGFARSVNKPCKSTKKKSN